MITYGSAGFAYSAVVVVLKDGLIVLHFIGMTIPTSCVTALFHG